MSTGSCNFNVIYELLYQRKIPYTYMYFPGPEWTRNGLTPLSDIQQFATIWLEQYFEAYGDGRRSDTIIDIISARGIRSICM